jgi:hypothetical protein
MEGIHSIEYNNLDSYFYIFWTKDVIVMGLLKSVERTC